MVLLARDLMHRELLSMDAGTSVRRAVQRMAAAHTGYVLVVRDGQPRGIVTEWDLLSRVMAIGRDAATVPIEEVATSPLVTMDVETPTDELVAAMAARGIRRMLLTENGRVVGIVTAKDVLQAFQRYIDKLSADIARLHLPSM